MTIDNNDRDKGWLLLIFLLIWAVLLLLTACSTEKKAQRKASWLIAHDKLGEFCNLLYPPRPDSIVTRDTTIYDTIPGESVIIHDSIKCKDTVIYRDVKCPPGETIYKTVYKDTTVYKDNPNQRAASDQQLRERDKVIAAKDAVILEQQKKIDKMDKWRLWFFILAFVNVLGIVFRLFIYKRPI